MISEREMGLDPEEERKRAARADRREAAATESVPIYCGHNAVIAEIQRLRPHYQSSSMLDNGRRQMLDHLESIAKGEVPTEEKGHEVDNRLKRYRAKGMEIFKNPVEERLEHGTRYQVGFPVCVATEYIGEDGAQALAALLDLGEEAQRTQFEPTAEDWRRACHELVYQSRHVKLFGAIEERAREIFEARREER